MQSVEHVFLPAGAGLHPSPRKAYRGKKKATPAFVSKGMLDGQQPNDHGKQQIIRPPPVPTPTFLCPPPIRLHLHVSPALLKHVRFPYTFCFSIWNRAGCHPFCCGIAPSLVSIGEKGARFRSYHDCSIKTLTPERSIEIQRQLGADLVVVLGERPA